ncbi:MAG: ATP-grasp domain-containing protein [Acidobacteria bacterium]|nr:MAG: ATP-grasp domain-containing protein [Acidobacteriota bacterium]
MSRSFGRIAIVNRGEPAMRLIHAAREFAREQGERLVTIALFTEPDRDAMFVREADEAVALGEATFVDPRDGQRKSTYLDYDRLREALATSGADAAWVGWGFVAEHPEFAELCEELGIVFIGPPARVMRELGDKITAKRIAEKARVPVAPWSKGPVESVDDALAHARRIGFPLLIKASAGGGGRGIRRVTDEDQLREVFERARQEALASFGDGTVFLEALVANARHVEVQIIADEHETVWPVGVRDCSVQRRNQKLIEESGSTALNSYREHKLRDAAARLCKAAGYVGAGTVEFLYDPKRRQLAFMEVNTRLQVEHPVTEQTTGLDLVKLQLHVARGGKLGSRPPRPLGYAIEARLNAEDPDNGFAPAPGRVALLRVPTGPGLRVDTGIAEGDRIAPEFDSMVAKIIASGRNRDEAIARLTRALAETTVVVQGGTTNKAFLLELLEREDFREGRVDIGWLDRLMASGDRPPRPHGAAALIEAALEVYREEQEVERQAFLYSAYRGRPHVAPRVGRKAELRAGGQAYEVTVHNLGGNAYRVEVDGARIPVSLEPISDFERRMTLGGTTHRVVSVADGVVHLVEIDGVPHRVSRDDGGLVRAPAPAIVVSLRVRPGDRVETGQTIAVLEAMKTEMPIAAPLAGQVADVLVSANEQVDAGTPLLRLEPEAEDAGQETAERLSFEEFAPPAAAEPTPLDRALRSLRELHRLALGFDVDPQRTRSVVAELESVREQVDPADERLRLAELQLLDAFADITYLSGRQPEPPDESGVPGPSPQQALFMYARALDAAGEGLPTRFVSALERALSHYGVTSLERSRELEEALIWIFKAHANVESQIIGVTSVLERFLRHDEVMRRFADDTLRSLLGRLVVVARGRFPALEDLAREVRYDLFDKPLLEEARRRVHEQVLAELEAIAADPDAPDRAERLGRVVSCPQPLLNLLTERFARADLSLRHLILESLTRRYYRTRNLENLRVVTVEGHPIAVAEFVDGDVRHHVFTTYQVSDRVASSIELMTPLLREVPSADAIDLDFFVRCRREDTSPDELRDWAAQTVDSLELPRRVERIVLSVTGFRTDVGPGQTHFTFRPDGHGFREDPLLRGVHPMMAERLDLDRLSNFILERLPSVEDIYLFHAVARDNPQDERLFALAEVRDLTPRRDREGRVVALPLLERLLREALAGIRRFQSTRSAESRLYMNRVVLFTREAMPADEDDLARLAKRMMPVTAGLGIEKIVIRALIPQGGPDRLAQVDIHISDPGGRGVKIDRRPPSRLPIRSLSRYRQKVVRMQRRGLHYPYEIVRMMTPRAEDTAAGFPPGEFVEHDLGPDGHLAPVDRPWGENTANVVVGVITNVTERHPEGMRRVIILGDPSRGLGSLAEPECRRIIGALDLAERLGVPVEWFAVSAGARISMESGTENMDWIALVLRRLVLFTQAGGEVNVIVHGINVGAQPYWNAEATMLMHTRGILVMTPEGAMVLTGKKALDYSGGVSAEDNHGIGGYDRVMGPNGQAQYWAQDIGEACRLLLRHYDHTYVVPGERFPRRAVTVDPVDRDVCQHPYEGTFGDFRTIGEILSPETNPGRKRPFEIRSVMRAVIDQDHAPLERWTAMQDAEIAVVWDAHLGGWPVELIGFESRPLPRAGLVPADGPEQWTAGTLFPRSSKKVARAINAASGNRPVVVLANLSGFDGSPESMRNWQLEFGAEIGRAIVNFEGPIVFCVISRYHGGAFVVFSRALNEGLESSALEHTYASVIGGAPAAAVVFAGEVRKRASQDPRVQALERQLRSATGARRARLQARYDELFKLVHAEKLGEVAAEFDRIHSIERAQAVGSIERIIPPQRLRPYLVEAVERGIEREQARPRGPRPFPDWTRLEMFRAPEKTDAASAGGPPADPPSGSRPGASRRRSRRTSQKARD